MGILHEALSALRATADKALDFAEPGKAISEAEDKFKSVIADTVHGIEERVAKLEAGGKTVVQSAETHASDAFSEIHDKFEELLSRLRDVESHPALSVPAIPPAPPAAPPTPDAAAADAPAAT